MYDERIVLLAVLICWIKFANVGIEVFFFVCICLGATVGHVGFVIAVEITLDRFVFFYVEFIL